MIEKMRRVITLTANNGLLFSKLVNFYYQAIASDFIRKVTETFATRILMIGIGLVTSVMVARILGPEGRGLYAVAITIGAIGVQFGNLGLHASNTYYVAQDHKLLSKLISNSLAISFLFGGVGGLITWTFFSIRTDIAPVHGTLLALALLSIPLGLAFLLLQNLLLGIQDVRSFNKVTLLTKVLTVIFLGIIIFLGRVTVETVVSVSLIVVILGLFWTLWKLFSYINHISLPSYTLFRNSIRYGFKAYLAAFFSFLVLKSDLLMVKSMLGSEQAGYYSIAASMADMVYMLPVVIGTILFPKLSAMVNKTEKWIFAKKVALGVGIIMIFLVIIAALLVTPLIKLMYGEVFLPATLPFIWLMLGIILLSVGTIFQNYMGATGNAAAMILAPLIGILVNIVLNLFLIERFGILGAAYSSTASYGIMFIVGFLVVQKMNHEDNKE